MSAPETLDRLAAAALQRPAEQRAVEFDDRWYDWGEVAAVARAVTERLAASGAAAGAPVGFVARNHPAALAALLALLAAGRSIQMIYPFQSAQALARDLERVRPAVVIAAAGDLSDPVVAALRDIGAAAIALDGMAVRALPGLERTTLAADDAEAGEPRIEILTSGTTGPPKRFPIPYAMIERHLLTGAATAGASRSGAEDPVPYLLYMPLGNISGIYTSIPPLIHGRPVVLFDRYTLARWHAFVVRYRPALTGVPPATVQALLDADIPAADLASIKYMGIGAAPLDPTVQAAFEDRYGIPMLLSYGATEFGGPVATLTPEHIARWGFAKRGSVGTALGAARLRVVDPVTGAERPAGEEGLLEVVSPRIGPDWLRTADLAVIDADGFLFIRGRVDGAINRGGFKLMPETIERALLLHPAIGAAAVVGVADPRLGEVPAAAVVAAAASNAPAPAELERHLREHVPATHIPAHWRAVDDLPKTPSLKIDRPAVRALFADAGRDQAA